MMFRINKTIPVIIVSLLLCLNSFSQEGWGIGACGLYNFNENLPGVGARVLIPVHKKLYAVPYVYYYFPNAEFSGGLSAMVPFYKYQSFSFYAIASGTFRASVSVTVNDSTTSSNKSYKAEGEAGIGVLIGKGCLKGMVEPRYAIINKEVTLRAGLVYFLSCSQHKKRNKHKSGHSAAKKKAYCPAYE